MEIPGRQSDFQSHRRTCAHASVEPGQRRKAQRVTHPDQAIPSTARPRDGTKHPSHTPALSYARLRTRRFERHDVLLYKSEAPARITACSMLSDALRCKEPERGEEPPVFDNFERDALREEGFDPDDPETVTAIDLVRWELSLLRLDPEVEQG